MFHWHEWLCPPTPRRGSTTLLLTVKNITSWLWSMARNEYELFPHPKRPRKQHSLWWLLKEVQLLSQEAGCPDSPGTLLYPTAVNLWFAYIRGYLSGLLAPGSEPSRAIVVRQEDILRRPQEVVVALAKLGLPRNGAGF